MREAFSHKAYGISAALLTATLCLCAACTSAPSPTPTATLIPLPTSIYNTSVAPAERATLPPTWTLTPTPTPSLTYTPSQTPTPSATYSLDDLCGTLEVDFPYDDDHVFASNDTLLLFFGTVERTWTSQIQAATFTPDPSVSGTPGSATPRPGVLTEPITVRFVAVHQDTGENLGAEATGGEITVLELPISQLPLPGDYDWSVSLFIGSLGEQCRRSGTFAVAEAEVTAEAQ